MKIANLHALAANYIISVSNLDPYKFPNGVVHALSGRIISYSPLKKVLLYFVVIHLSAWIAQRKSVKFKYLSVFPHDVVLCRANPARMLLSVAGTINMIDTKQSKP